MDETNRDFNVESNSHQITQILVKICEFESNLNLNSSPKNYQIQAILYKNTFCLNKYGIL